MRAVNSIPVRDTIVNRLKDFVQTTLKLIGVKSLDQIGVSGITFDKKMERSIAEGLVTSLLGFSRSEFVPLIGGVNSPTLKPKNLEKYPWVLYVVPPLETDLMEVFHKSALQFMLGSDSEQIGYVVITNLKELIVCDRNHYIADYDLDFQTIVGGKNSSDKTAIKNIAALESLIADFGQNSGSEKLLEHRNLPLKLREFLNQFRGNAYTTSIQRGRGKSEENIKVHIVDKVLTKFLGSNYHAKDLDYEHDVKGKRIDIAIIHGHRVKLVVEVKDASDLAAHAKQAYDYADQKGAEWFVLTNGVNWVFYAKHIPGVVDLSEKVLFEFSIFDSAQKWKQFNSLISRNELFDNFEKNLKDLRSKRRPKITAEILHEELQFAKDLLHRDLKDEFISKYKSNIHFQQEIDNWALKTKLNVKDKGLIDKLCMEGAYSLINRLILYRISECQGLLPEKLSENCIAKWKEAVAEPQKELLKAFNEANNFYSDFFNYPLFNSIRFEDITWNESHINDILSRFAAFDFASIEEDIIGAAYEKHLSIENRKRIGQYYTYDFVVEYMVEQLPIDKKLKYLDPACGSGGFIIKLYNHLIDKHGPGSTKDILSNSLHGCDINPFATQLTKMNLLLRAMRHKVFKIKLGNILTADSLAKVLGSKKLISQKKNNIGKAYSDSFLEYNNHHLSTGQSILMPETFDVIVANPPYISLGAWRSAQIDEKYSEDLQDFYSEYYSSSAEYKISTYAVFLERAIELAKPGATVQFIIPDSFLAGKYFKKLRQHLLRSADIEEIMICFEDFWEDAQVGFPVVIRMKKVSAKESKLRASVIDILNKLDTVKAKVLKVHVLLADGKQASEGSHKRNKELGERILLLEKELEEAIELCSFNTSIEVRFAKTAQAIIQRKFSSHKQEQEAFLRNYNNRFTLFQSQSEEKIFQCVNRSASNLEMLVSIECGLCGKGGQAGIVSATKKGGKWFPGISSAKHLNEYVYAKSEEFLNLDKTALVRGFNVSYSKPKLIIPKTGDRIKCSVDENGMLVSDNLQVVIPREKYSGYLYAMAGILNSNIFNSYYRIITLEEGRVNAQTDIDTLYSIPIIMPEQDQVTYDLLEKKVRSLAEALRKAGSKKNSFTQKQERKLREEIEICVAKLLNISDKTLLEHIGKKAA